MSTRIMRRILILLALALIPDAAAAFSWQLDSIAQMGKFPRFCVDTYNWANIFFNGTDTAYVRSTGYRWNIKLRTASWADMNEFYFDRHHVMHMQSPYCSSIGLDVQYMAVAIGYDININKLFGGADRSKSRFNFEFSSARFSGRLYSVTNRDGMIITRLNNMNDIDTDFRNMNTNTFGVDLTYFLNMGRYSNGAAFSYSKLQMRSQGSWIFTAAYQRQKMNFDFRSLPSGIKQWLPDDWSDSTYTASGYNIGIGAGYGFNWVPCRNLTIGIMALAIPSVNHGYLNSPEKRCSFRLNYRGGASVVWNHNRWFIGTSIRADAGFIYSDATTLINALPAFDLKIGWRFNLF